MQAELGNNLGTKAPEHGYRFQVFSRCDAIGWQIVRNQQNSTTFGTSTLRAGENLWNSAL